MWREPSQSLRSAFDEPPTAVADAPPPQAAPVRGADRGQPRLPAEMPPQRAPARRRRCRPAATLSGRCATQTAEVPAAVETPRADRGRPARHRHRPAGPPRRAAARAGPSRVARSELLRTATAGRDGAVRARNTPSKPKPSDVALALEDIPPPMQRQQTVSLYAGRRGASRPARQAQARRSATRSRRPPSHRSRSRRKPRHRSAG